jgi:glutamyl-tRNA reductase
VDLLVEGVSHRVAPLDVRERLFIDGDAVRDRLGWLAALPGVRAAAILSTCGRTEVYLSAETAVPGDVDLGGLLADTAAAADWERHRYRLDGDAALAHVFRVPSGLDSAVVGEGQILGQFKMAMAEARMAMSLDAGLEFVMQRAINVAKRVRTETELGRRPVGFGQAAVVLAQARLGGLGGRSALIVGAGKMAGATARSLAAAGVNHLFFSNRTRERAAELAGDMPAGVPADAITHAEIEEAALESDLIICSSSSPDHIIGRPMMDSLMRRRQGRPMFLLDLAVPRDVAPDVGGLDGVHLYNIDDLGAATREAFASRWQEVPAAEAIIAQEVRRAAADIGRRRADPAVTALVDAMESQRLRLMRALPSDFSPEQTDEVDRITRALTARLLHEPILHLRDNANDPDALTHARQVLGLSEDEEGA